jgi:hypothetical protein
MTLRQLLSPQSSEILCSGHERAYAQDGRNKSHRHSGNRSLNADLAASVVLGPWQLAFGPVPVDGDQEESFDERWIQRFAQAVVGKLSPPQNCPLPVPQPGPGSGKPAPELKFSAEKESLFQLAAKDRRAAIKKSWELLAKDILWAGNVGMERSDPDSPAMSHALRRLESSTTYPLELLVESSTLLQERYSISPNGHMIPRNQRLKNSSSAVKPQGCNSGGAEATR